MIDLSSAVVRSYKGDALEEERHSAKWMKANIYGFAVIHLLAALAFLPWFFSWTGVILLIAGCYVFGVLGINVCFHRLLTHRSFTCPRWLEYAGAILAVCSVQDSPSHWVALHRRHHHFADEEQDPHSPLRSFFWAHMGWLLVKIDDAPLIGCRISDQWA